MDSSSLFVRMCVIFNFSHPDFSLNLKPISYCFLQNYKIEMQALRSVAFLFLAGVVMKAASTAPSGSDFVAAVYEHAFVRVENRTAVLLRQEAVAIVMSNMDVYETQMQKAKEQVLNLIYNIHDHKQG